MKPKPIRKKVVNSTTAAQAIGYPLGLTAADFPVKSPALRRTIATDHERCPECGGFLDTGNECNDCGFDAMPEVRDFDDGSRQRRARLGGDQAKPMTDEDIFTLVSYGLRTEPRLFEVLFPAVQLRNKRVYIWLYERKCLVERGPREELNIVRFVNKEEAKMFRDVLNHEFPNVVARVTYGPDHRRVCGEA